MCTKIPQKSIGKKYKTASPSSRKNQDTNASIQLPYVLEGLFCTFPTLHTTYHGLFIKICFTLITLRDGYFVSSFAEESMVCTEVWNRRRWQQALWLWEGNSKFCLVDNSPRGKKQHSTQESHKIGLYSSKWSLSSHRINKHDRAKHPTPANWWKRTQTTQVPWYITLWKIKSENIKD